VFTSGVFSIREDTEVLGKANTTSTFAVREDTEVLGNTAFGIREDTEVLHNRTAFGIREDTEVLPPIAVLHFCQSHIKSWLASRLFAV
jgi:hypothetical protein